MKKRIYELEQQWEKYAIELSQANAKYFHAQKQKNEALAALRKQIAEVQARLEQQRNLYEAVCTDRNLYSKNLIESHEEIAEMRRKFKIIYHQIEQHKEEIKEKDQTLIKDHFEHHKVQQACEQTKELETTIQEAEAEKRNQRKELEGVIAERDILG